MAKATKTELEYLALRNLVEIFASTIGRTVFTAPDNRTLKEQQAAFVDAVSTRAPTETQTAAQMAVRALERVLYENPEFVVTERNYGPLDIYRAFAAVNPASSTYDLTLTRKYIEDALPKAVKVGAKVLDLLDEGRTPLYALPEDVVEELHILFNSGVAELSNTLDKPLQPAQAASKPAARTPGTSRTALFYAGSDHIARDLMPLYLRALGSENLVELAETLEAMPPLTESSDMVPWVALGQRVSRETRPYVVDTYPTAVFVNMLENVGGAQRLRGKQTVMLGGTVQRRTVVKPQEQVEVGTQRVSGAHHAGAREAASVLAAEIARLIDRPVTFSRAERQAATEELNESLRAFAQKSGITIPRVEVPEAVGGRVVYREEPNQSRTFQIVDVLRTHVATALLEAVKNTLKDPPSAATTAAAEAWVKRLEASHSPREIAAVLDFYKLLDYMQDTLNNSDASEFTQDFMVLKSGIAAIKTAVENAYCLLRTLVDPATWQQPTSRVRISCTPSRSGPAMVKLLKDDPETYHAELDSARAAYTDALLTGISASFFRVADFVNSRPTSTKANGELRKSITAFRKAGVEVDAQVRANRTRNLRSSTRHRPARATRR